MAARIMLKIQRRKKTPERELYRTRVDAKWGKNMTVLPV
jgi:hypothetical protein